MSATMQGSELAYVKEQLKKYTHREWEMIARAAKVNFRTVKRIAYNETAYPRSDTTGKLALYFRTIESRRRQVS